MANLGLLVILILALEGCGKNLPYNIQNKNQNQVSQEKTLSGEFLTSDSKTINLKELNDRPVILIFSQDTCTVCAHEADTLRDSIKNQSKRPTRVYLYSILVGAATEDAADWKLAHHLAWDVGIDTNAILFKKYCSTLTVPCSIVQLPDRGIVLRQNGAIDFKDFTNLTGPWEDSL